MSINGKTIASRILEDLKFKIQKLDIVPHLAIILIGNDPASIAYVNQKKIKAEKIGARTSIYKYPNSISEKALLQHLNDLNHLSTVHGIIVQQPLPSHINIKKITQAIDPKKDVDGFNTNSKFEMPLSMAVLKILEEVHASTPGVEPRFIDWLKSKQIIIMGKGETGGEPIVNSFKKMDIEPIVIDSKTKNPQVLTKTADIIISAVGKTNVVKPDMIKKGVILISIGLHKGLDGKLHGDYEENEIKNIVSFYTPTPGGVGPVNVSMLLKNVVIACENFVR